MFPSWPLDQAYLLSLGVAILLASVAWTHAARGPRAPGLVALAIALLLVQAVLYVPYTVDDSFISFRFAANWAEGLGPVYQAGDRVEGYTSFLWIVLLAGACSLGADLETVSKVLGGVCAIVTLVLLPRLVRVWRPGRGADGIAALLLAGCPLFAAWTFAGMDAPLFALLLTAASGRFLVERRATSRFPWSALLFGALWWARPEGALFSAAAGGSLLLGARDDPPVLRRDALRWIAICCAVAVPYWVGRWVYYGQFFPNTFYAKTSLSAGRLLLGVASLADFVADGGLLILLLVVVALVGARRRDTGDRFLFGALGLFLCYVVVVGGDVLHLRFYVHILPLWSACAAVGLLDLCGMLGRGAHAGARRDALASVAFGLALLVAAYHGHARALHPRDQFGAAYVVDNGTNIRNAHLPLGDWLRAHAPAGVRAAVTDIGGVGYRSRLGIVDLYGLTDRAIARLLHRKASRQEIVAHLASRRPELLVLYGTSHGANLGSLAGGREWVEREYRAHSFWPDSPLDKGLVLLVRRDLSLAGPSPPGRPMAAP